MKNNQQLNINIIPIVKCTNFFKDKNIIYKENKNKSGIYNWNNLVTGKYYIGFSVSLALRLTKYYFFDYLKNNRNSSNIIHNSRLK